MKKILSYAAVLILALSTAPALAGPATDSVKDRQEQLFSVIAQPKNAARKNKLRTLFDGMLDYDVLAKGSLGKKWADRSGDEKTKFTGLLTELVRNNYRRNLTKMLDYNIEFVGEETKGAETLVKTVAKHKTDAREPQMEIDFLVSGSGGKLKVVDIITERASMTKTYRAQFLRIIRKKGWDTLMEKMEKKVAKSK